MYLASPITTTTKPLYDYERQFAICESCFWCATIFQKADNNSSNNNDSLQQQKICPLCENKSISLISLSKDEISRMSMEGKRGLDA
jgi:hypothetical protein